MVIPLELREIFVARPGRVRADGRRTRAGFARVKRSAAAGARSLSLLMVLRPTRRPGGPFRSLAFGMRILGPVPEGLLSIP